MFSGLEDDSTVNNLHKMIAILSGQLAPTILEETLLISLGDTPQSMVSTNAKLCATNQSTAWGVPVYVPPLPPLWCAVRGQRFCVLDRRYAGTA